MPSCSRRSLLQMTSVLAAGHTVRSFGQAFAPATAAGDWPPHGTRLYASLRASSSQLSGIGTFVWIDDAWVRQDFLPAVGAGPMVVDTSGKFLFVAHDAKASGLPTGSVEALRIDPLTGRLSRGQQQPLALGSRLPQAMALAPSGRLLVVVAAGGVFSIVPIQLDGTLAEVSAAHKQLAIPFSGDGEMSLAFDDAAHPGSHPVLVDEPLLRLQTAGRCMEYECCVDGLTLTATSNGRGGLHAMITPPLPFGTRSYALQPPL